jgi:hypothetical protein
MACKLKRALTIALIGLAVSAKAQEPVVDKSVFGIQTGFLGIWAHGEFGLNSKIALRVEFGLDGAIWGGTLYEKTGFNLAPVLTAEPRWYYNLPKRESKDKRVDHNSGDFISVKTSYQPDWFLISNDDDRHPIGFISMIPTWGIRRNMGEHFNYEAGAGVGYRYIFPNMMGYKENQGEIAFNLHLRIGFVF